MTAGEIETLKNNIRKVMITHLTSIGYPNITNERVMKELKPMWLKIEEAGLVVKGMNFQNFVEVANHHFLISEVNDIMGV